MTRTVITRIAAVLILVAIAGAGVFGLVLSPGSARRTRLTGQTTPGVPAGLAELPSPRERRGDPPEMESSPEHSP